MNLDGAFPGGSEGRALSRDGYDSGDGLAMFRHDDGLVMVGDIIQELEAFGFELGGGDLGFNGHVF